MSQSVLVSFSDGRLTVAVDCVIHSGVQEATLTLGHATLVLNNGSVIEVGGARSATAKNEEVGSPTLERAVLDYFQHLDGSNAD